MSRFWIFAMVGLHRLVLVFLLGMGFAQSAGAQASMVSGQHLQISCGLGNCENAVRAAVKQLLRAGLSAQELNSQLGILAAILFETARDGDENTIRQVALGLQILAQFSSDTEQQQSLIQVAQVILDGGGGLFNLDDPFAVSPS